VPAAAVVVSPQPSSPPPPLLLALPSLGFDGGHDSLEVEACPPARLGDYLRRRSLVGDKARLIGTKMIRKKRGNSPLHASSSAAARARAAASTMPPEPALGR
jgi:hypothetical protein